MIDVLFLIYVVLFSLARQSKQVGVCRRDNVRARVNRAVFVCLVCVCVCARASVRFVYTCEFVVKSPDQPSSKRARIGPVPLEYDRDFATRP